MVERFEEMTLGQLGRVIDDEWNRPFYGAIPYMRALLFINDDGRYGCDSWDSIVAYFLGNAKTWKGPVARQMKAELNRRLKAGSMEPMKPVSKASVVEVQSTEVQQDLFERGSA